MKSLWKKIDKLLDSVAKFDYFRLIPTGVFTKGERYSFGVELTLRHVGPGVGLGLGKIDLWVGWPPKPEEPCADHEKCLGQSSGA